ncbi:MAG TPA: M57 family metalloprotease [Polyangiaceae bacterium]|nr:M57 family metalloprotease [Polyangiaceae bacterium]
MAGFPSDGVPFPTILISSTLAAYGVDTIEHVITHEIGHTLGFRHADFFNRAISCGTGGDEGAGATGAVLIPGTPSTAVVGGSVMNSCHRANETGEFTSTDLTALNALYGVARKPLEFDLNGDGFADVCGRGVDGVNCALSWGVSFDPVGLWSPTFSDAGGWSVGPQYYATIEFIDLNGDGRADVCGRGIAGVQCALSSGTGRVRAGRRRHSLCAQFGLGLRPPDRLVSDLLERQQLERRRPVLFDDSLPRPERRRPRGRVRAGRRGHSMRAQLGHRLRPDRPLVSDLLGRRRVGRGPPVLFDNSLP